MKKLFIILIIAAIFRVPAVLYTDVSGDSRAYFNQAVEIFNNGYSSASIESVHKTKILFTSFLAIVVGPLYRLIGDTEITVSIVSFIFSIILVWSFWLMLRSVYGDEIAFWASLIFAVLPYNLSSSNTLLAHNYILMFMFWGLYFLNRFLKENKIRFIIAAAILLAYLIKVRPEGVLIFLFIAIVSTSLIGKGYFNSNGYAIHEKVWKKTAFAWAGSFIVMYAVSFLINHAVGSAADSSQTGSTNPIIGKALGNIARKIQALFAVQPKGSLTQSDKLVYITNNLKLVMLSSAVYIYDLFKTMFVLPMRIIPPYVWFLAGASLFDTGKYVRHDNKTILLFSLTLIFAFFCCFIYPALYLLSHSRYVYLVVPIACLGAGIGLSNLVGRFRMKRTSEFAAISILLVIVIFNYLLPCLGMCITSGRPIIFQHVESRVSAIDNVQKYINKNYPDLTIPVMGLGPFTSALPGKPRLDYPQHYHSDNFLFVPDTISLLETITLLDKNRPALVLIPDTRNSKPSRVNRAYSYFSRSLELNNPFVDEGLELMRSAEEKDHRYIYSQLLDIIDNRHKYEKFKFVETFSDQTQTLYLFEYGMETPRANRGESSL